MAKEIQHVPAVNIMTFLSAKTVLKPLLPFINGGVAGMFATSCIQPIDFVKVQIQISKDSKPSPISIIRAAVRQGGISELYTGFSAALLRQATYTTLRLGLFHTFQTLLENRRSSGRSGINVIERGAAGISAGGFAALIGNPADLALVRMQTDKTKPIQQRANYRGVWDTIRTIIKNEGPFALWAGAKPTVVRAMAMNFGQLTFFAETKDRVRTLSPESGQGFQWLVASAVAGFFATALSLPFDFLKTRLQEQEQEGAHRLKRSGLLRYTRSVVLEEGWLVFYRGFGTYYLRVAPQAMITLVVADYLNLLTL